MLSILKIFLSHQRSDGSGHNEMDYNSLMSNLGLYIAYLAISSVIFVNENENENYRKRKNNDSVNDN